MSIDEDNTHARGLERIGLIGMPDKVVRKLRPILQRILGDVPIHSWEVGTLDPKALTSSTLLVLSERSGPEAPSLRLVESLRGDGVASPALVLGKRAPVGVGEIEAARFLPLEDLSKETLLESLRAIGVLPEEGARARVEGSLKVQQDLPDAAFSQDSQASNPLLRTVELQQTTLAELRTEMVEAREEHGRLEELEQQVADLRRQLAESGAICERQNATLDLLSKAKGETEDQLREARASLEKSSDTKEKLSAERDRFEEQLSSVVGERDRLADRVSLLEIEQENLTKEKADLGDQRDEALAVKGRVQELETRLEQAREERILGDARLERAMEGLEASHQTVVTLEEQVIELARERRGEQAQLSQAEERLVELEPVADELIGVREDLETLKKAQKRTEAERAGEEGAVQLKKRLLEEIERREFFQEELKAAGKQQEVAREEREAQAKRILVLEKEIHARDSGWRQMEALVKLAEQQRADLQEELTAANTELERTQSLLKDERIRALGQPKEGESGAGDLAVRELRMDLGEWD